MTFNNQGNGQQPPQRQMPELKPGTVKKAVIGLIAAVAVIYLGSSSFYTVQEQERAAVLTFGEYRKETTAGLQFKWPYPIQEVKIVPAELTQRIHIGYRMDGGTETVIEEESMMITGDENIVSADAVVQWKISNVHDYLFNIDDAETFLRNSASSSIRAVIGSERLDYAITEGKTVIQDKVREKLIELMNHYQTGIQIIDIKFQDIEPPSGQVAEAFREVTNAREEKNTKVNNAKKYENDIIPKARGEAQALLERAEGEKQSRILNAQGDVAQFNAIFAEYSNNANVTENRLILETLEEIMPGAKIVITNSSGDTVNYLPLNELMGSSSASRPQVQQQQSQPAPTPPPASQQADTQEGDDAQ